MANSTTRKINIQINGKEIINTISSIKKEKQNLIRELNKMTVGSKEYNEQIKKIKDVDKHIENHYQNLRKTDSALSKMGASMKSMAGLAGLAFGADMLVDFGKELFKSGTEMETLGKKAATVFGETMPQITEEARKHAHQMGLTKGQYIDAAAAIQDVLIPMQFQRDEAANISSNLVNLSGALSEWTGGQKSAQEVSQILSKAMLGEREQLKGLGIVIQEADVKARLLEKGLNKLTGASLQQAKAAATLELITEKSSDAQAQYAENSDSLVRKQAEMAAKFEEVKEAMATALIPVFHRLMDAVEPTIDTVVEVVETFQKGEKQTTTFGKTLSLLGKLFSTIWDRLQPLGSLFSSIVNVLTGDFSLAFEYAKLSMVGFTNNAIKNWNILADLMGKDSFKFELFDEQAIQDNIDKLEEAAKKANDVQNSIKNPNTETKTSETKTFTTDNVRKESVKTDDKAVKKLEREQEKLNKVIQKFQDERHKAQLDANEKELFEIEKKFQKEIELAKSLGQAGIEQKLELEDLMHQALEEKKDEQYAAELERREEEHLEAAAAKEAKFWEDFEAEKQRDLDAYLLKQEYLKEREEERMEAEEALREATTSAQELAAEELDKHYAELLKKANKYGLDTTALEKKWVIDQAKQRDAAFQERMNTHSQNIGNLQSILTSAMEIIGSKSKEAVILQKALAITQIAIDTARGISSAIAAGAGLPFPANLPAIASGVAAVLGGIAQAKAVMKSIPEATQRKKGGFAQVRGADDKKIYNAKMLEVSKTGYLPNYPVLTPSGVLASEEGREYFISNPDLQNPIVLKHVEAIENIRTGATEQKKDGGFTNTDSLTPPAFVPIEKEPNQLILEKLSSIERLLRQGGIFAKIDDETTIDIFRKFDEINSASGFTIRNR